ncbi:MAG: (5-formylfuran-3-yl)methyl phosphate synthase, partial [Pirellulaceae bacterium]|nr:(5-formylfuran-3-yl)methyl phosphate synthase [Pirellulaceae bacterium]
MTELLVSVRDANEAQQALAGGADVIDVKEPARGALGAADPEVWHHVRRAIPLDVRLSVALGELTDDDIAE